MSTEEFCVSIVTCDSYQCHPFKGYDETYCQFRGRAISRIPIIRVFGVTPSGQKTCVHVHGTYPYISVEYEGEIETATEYSQHLASSLEKTLNKGAKTPKQHVHNINLFQAVPFYGFYEEKKNFLKIRFYSTSSLKKAVDLLHSGVIMNQSFQPYEAHIPYMLQFFIDHNLFGMNMLRLRRVAFRPNENVFPVACERTVNSDVCDPKRWWNPENIPSENIVKITRQSVCELEVDCIASDILNTLDINVAVNPGLAAIWEDERQRHKEKFNESEVTPLASQERSQVEITAAEKRLLLAWKEKLFNLQLGRSQEVKCSNDSDDDIDYSFVEVMANMKANEEADCILNTQHSSSSLFNADTDVSESDDDEKETLQMSQIINLENLNENTMQEASNVPWTLFGEKTTSFPLETNSSFLFESSKHPTGSKNQPVNVITNVEVLSVSDNSESNDIRQMSEVFSYNTLIELTSNSSETNSIVDNVVVKDSNLEPMSSSGSNIPPSGKVTIERSETPASSNEDFIIQLDGAHVSDDSDSHAAPVKPVLRLRNKTTRKSISTRNSTSLHQKSIGSEVSSPLQSNRLRRLSLRNSKPTKNDDSTSTSRTVSLNLKDSSSVTTDKILVQSVSNVSNSQSEKQNDQSRQGQQYCDSSRLMLSQVNPSKRILRNRVHKPSLAERNVKPSLRQKHKLDVSVTSHSGISETAHELPDKAVCLLLDNRSIVPRSISLNKQIGNEKLFLKRLNSREIKKYVHESKNTEISNPTEPKTPMEPRNSVISSIPFVSLKDKQVPDNDVNQNDFKLNYDNLSEDPLNCPKPVQMKKMTNSSTVLGKYQEIFEVESKLQNQELRSAAILSTNTCKEMKPLRMPESSPVQDNYRVIDLMNTGVTTISESTENVNTYDNYQSEDPPSPQVKRLPNILEKSVQRSGERDVLFNLSFMSSSSSNFSSQNSPPRCLSPCYLSSTQPSYKTKPCNEPIDCPTAVVAPPNDSPGSEICDRMEIISPASDFKDNLVFSSQMSLVDSEHSEVLRLSDSSEGDNANSQKSSNSKHQSSDSFLCSPRSDRNEHMDFLRLSGNNILEGLESDSSIQLTQESRTSCSSRPMLKLTTRGGSPSYSFLSTPTLVPDNLGHTSTLVTSFFKCLNASPENTNDTLVASNERSEEPETSKDNTISSFSKFGRILTSKPPPLRRTVENNLKDDNMLVQNKPLFIPKKMSELEEFKSSIYTDATWKNLTKSTVKCPKSQCDILTPVILPPSRRVVHEWCNFRTLSKAKRSKEINKASRKKVKIELESTPQSVSILSSIGRLLHKNEGLSRRKRLFQSMDQRNHLSPIPSELELSHSSDASSPNNTSSLQVATPRRFGESFSMIEGHCSSGEVVIPAVREKFFSSKTNEMPLSLLSMELHVQTRGNLRPDPKQDPILGIFFCLQRIASDPSLPAREAGAFIVSPEKPGTCTRGGSGFFYLGVGSIDVTTVDSEKDLLDNFVQLMKRWDPDIVIGYEIQRQSWGYLLERWSPREPALCSHLSRIPEASKTNTNSVDTGFDADDPGSDFISEVTLSGRIVLNGWKILRGEFALNSYTFENVFHHILNKRIPKYSYKVLTELYDFGVKQRHIVLEYYLQRSIGSVELFEHFNLVGRTSELARIIGIQFFEVFSRGSQFRVESIMLRLVKDRGFLPVSCSMMQRAHARAPECVQLILEPDSKLYTDPVLVLDFQSLYPSIIIAYNYCYSTCLGRLEHLGKNGPFEFGCTTLTVSPSLLKTIENDVTISPNGVVFVKPSVRKGVLPVMLEEILNTRFMVKKSMKENKGNKAVEKLLDARQLAMKLIANVTYGYTGANFSGRMPCVEVADSILSKSRETLENAIRLVESKWGASVVYGDTDSMFVSLPGRSKAEAFRIGQEMVDAVTDLNPKPVKLKFEKVYLPFILQTKKRYVGYMYETLDQAKPVFDAKGIETVRRDSCPAVPKVLEKSLRILFDQLDMRAVESYIKRQFQKVLCGRASMQDLIFAKEYRGREGYRPGACVPALEIAKRVTQVDPRAEPLSGERVPYVIVYGPPGLPLIRLVKQPQEVLADPALKLNAIYYTTRVLAPPLDRMLALIGVNVFKWIQELPRVCAEAEAVNDSPPSHGYQPAPAKASLSQYFSRVGCLVCDVPSEGGLCLSCLKDPQMALVSLGEKQALALRKQHHLLQICQSCSGICSSDISCCTLDCPVAFQVIRCRGEVRRSTHNRKQACKLLHLEW